VQHEATESHLEGVGGDVVGHFDPRRALDCERDQRADDTGRKHLARTESGQSDGERQAGQRVGISVAAELDVQQTKLREHESDAEDQQHGVAGRRRLQRDERAVRGDGEQRQATGGQQARKQVRDEYRAS
jgi:hypothetical protein